MWTYWQSDRWGGTLVLSLILTGLTLSRPDRGTTQILPDNTLVEPSIVTREDAVLRITGGTPAGANLFHSFEEFNVLTPETAYFERTLSIENIIARVTGDRLSYIDGTIAANGSANLFLLNPNGTIFGPNATLDIGGSFFASSAQSLLFEDGYVYSVRDPKPLLTVSVPIGLQLNRDSGPILVTGPGHHLRFDPNTIATIRDARPAGLQVPDGQTLALVGGEITLIGGNLTAAGGHIELGSIEDGTIAFTPTSVPTGNAWTFDYQGVATFADIDLSAAASVDTSGEGGGFVGVRARNLSITAGSSILADTLGDRPGGGVRILTSESVDVTGLAEDGSFFSSIFAAVAPEASGAGGNISVMTEMLHLSDDGTIAADTFGTGDAGSIALEGRTIDMNRSFVATIAQRGSRGNGGDLTVEADRLVVAEGAQILTLTEGVGNAGNLTIHSTESVDVTGTGVSFGFSLASALAATAEQGSTGNGGNLTLETARLRVRDGGGIGSGTDGSGNAGHLTIWATESVEVAGNSDEGLPSNIFTSLFTGPAALGNNIGGMGGTLTLETGRLMVRDGGQISVGTLGGGQGGNLDIHAAEGVELSGSIPVRDFAQRTFFRDESQERIPSGLFAVSEGSGQAGNLSVVTPELVVRDGARATVESRNAGNAGSAGNLEIEARTIVLDGDADLRADSQGGLGNIELRSDRLQLRHNSQISTNSTGIATGGNITIETQTLVALENSDISANARNSRGGRVTIFADGIFATPDSNITASSERGLEFSGTIDIQTPHVDPARGIVAVSDDALDSIAPIALSCLVPSHRQQGRFVILGSGGLPTSPESAANSMFETYTIPETSPETTNSPQDRVPGGETVVPLVEAQGIFQLEDDRFVLGRQCE